MKSHVLSAAVVNCQATIRLIGRGFSFEVEHENYLAQAFCLLIICLFSILNEVMPL